MLWMKYWWVFVKNNWAFVYNQVVNEIFEGFCQKPISNEKKLNLILGSCIGSNE